MTETIVCPHCSAQLSPPNQPGTELQCPVCQGVFAGGVAQPSMLHQAQVYVAPPKVEEPAVLETPEPETPVPETLDPTPESPKLSDFRGEGEANSPPSTLSDWLKRDLTDSDAPPEQATAPEQAEAPEKDFDPHQTVQDFPPQPVGPSEEPAHPAAEAASQPSLESLLSSFRGEPVEPEAETKEAAPDAAAPDAVAPDAGLTDAATQEPPPVEPTLAAKAPTYDAVADDTIANIASMPMLGDNEPSVASSAAEQPKPAAETAETPPKEAASFGSDSAATIDDVRSFASVAEPVSKDFEFEIEESAVAPSVSRSVDGEPEEDGVAFPELAPASRYARRRGSSMRAPIQVAAVVLGGAMGVGLGYLGLLWVKGPSGDVLNAASYLPQGLLPASFAASPEEPVRGDGEPLRRDYAVEPATLEAPIEDAPAGGSLAADTPVPKPQPFRLSPKGCPVFAEQDLQQSLAGAEDARKLMSSSSLAKDPAMAKQLGGAYSRLCELAGRVTFYKPSPGADDMTVLEGKELFQRLFQYGHARVDSRDMVGRWLAWGDRDHGGVFFAAGVVSAEKRGSVYEYRVKLADNRFINVLSAEPINPMRFNFSKELGVVGWVLDSPSTQVPGYTGDSASAVWAGHTISLGAPKFN